EWLSRLGEVRCRIETNEIGACAIEGAQQGAVVAADVDDDVARRQANELPGAPYDFGQSVSHGLVDAGHVPVVVVDQLLRKGMAQLHETAGVFVERGIATDQVERDFS